MLGEAGKLLGPALKTQRQAHQGGAGRTGHAVLLGGAYAFRRRLALDSPEAHAGEEVRGGVVNR